jgi:hypothetical protein
MNLTVPFSPSEDKIKAGLKIVQSFDQLTITWSFGLARLTALLECLATGRTPEEPKIQFQGFLPCGRLVISSRGKYSSINSLKTAFPHQMI